MWAHLLAAVGGVLLDAAPDSLRIVVSTRSTPPLHLSRRRAATALSEIGVEDLRLDADEVEALLNGPFALRLTPSQLAAVDERLHGWAAGLALAASSLREDGGRARTDFVAALAQSRRSAAEYLTEEVLDEAAPATRAFLVRTSILDRLIEPLCEAVVGDPKAREILGEIRRSRLFVTVADDDGETLRLHPMFADVLRGELERREPELVPLLHLRASRWFEAQGLSMAAIAHATAAGDGRRAARLLRDRWPALVALHRHATLRRLLDALPPDRGELDGFCEALDVLCLELETGDPELVGPRLRRLVDRRDEPGVAEIIDPLRLSPLHGDVGAALAAGRELWEDARDRPEARLRITAEYGLLLWAAGDPAAARAVIEPRLDRLEAQPSTHMRALAVLSLAALDEGEPKAAAAHARRAVEVMRAGGSWSASGAGLVHVAHGAAMTAVGRLDEAAEALGHAAALARTIPGSIAQATVLLFQARLDLARGDRPRARARAASIRRTLDRFPDVGTLPRRVAEIEEALDEASCPALAGTTPTPAELRVLALLPTDASVADIAAVLHLSPNTVRSHVRRLYRRLGVRSREDAVRIAGARGLLPR
ncbi:MAG: hypothetical protein IRZ32_05015 [Solirubrobacteraceae bacterium]|nr:hypothetical protein [Solirubrobacteraceae bacterium]